MDIIETVIAGFGTYGPEGMLLGLFLVVVADAMVIPLGPELLAIAIFSTSVTTAWGALIVGAVMIGQVAGTSFLYAIGRHPRIMPGRIKRLMERYRSSLLINDERIVFVNCFIPILPFLGAFVAVSKWSYRRAMSFVMLGGAIKYSLFLGLSGTFHYLFETGIAQKVSLLTVLALLVASAAYALRKRKALQVDEATIVEEGEPQSAISPRPGSMAEED